MDNTDDQFSLKWNNFQANLATGFHDLLQEEMMVDVTLAAEGKFLQAHKIILSVCSPYFKDLFKVNPCKHPIVILKDVGHQEMADMLDFMYRGEANVRQEDLAAFLKLAETLKVKGLAGDKSGDDDTGSAPSQPPRKHPPQQVPKKKKMIETSVFESDDHDPGDTDYNPGGGEPRRKKRRSSPQPKTDSVMPSSSSSAQYPLANPKQEMPDPEEIQLIDDGDEVNDPIAQLMSGQGTKQEQDHHEFDDSNFDNTMDDTGDGSHENDFDMSAGPSNPDESTDQVPQEGDEIEAQSDEEKDDGNDDKVVKKGKKTLIWSFFSKGSDGMAECRLCMKMITLPKEKTFSALNRHLRCMHPGLKWEFAEKDRKGKSPGLETSDTKVTSQKDRRYTSAAWNYFKKVMPGKVECSLCNVHLVHKQNTTGMIRHLRDNHSETLAANGHLSLLAPGERNVVFSNFNLLENKAMAECKKCKTLVTYSGSRQTLVRHMNKFHRNQPTNCTPRKNEDNENDDLESRITSFIESTEPDDSEVQSKKEWLCHQCDRSYAVRRNLTRHLRYECSRLPQFKCEFCYEIFRYRNRLQQHIETAHSDLTA